jgi:hypothetical protein
VKLQAEHNNLKIVDVKSVQHMSMQDLAVLHFAGQRKMNFTSCIASTWFP